MMFGTTAKILRVDLTTAAWEVEELTEDFYRLYPGGKALAGYILLNELPAHTDALSPQNILVAAAGLLTGAPLSKNPLTTSPKVPSPPRARIRSDPCRSA